MNSRYECTCQPGYKLVDGQCLIADCLTNPTQCHVNAQCISAIDGSNEYRCVCIFGYHGDGIHQCIEEHIGCNNINNCGRNAVCGYNQTSNNYACVCLPVSKLNLILNVYSSSYIPLNLFTVNWLYNLC
jgi:hypothetical protein